VPSRARWLCFTGTQFNPNSQVPVLSLAVNRNGTADVLSVALNSSERKAVEASAEVVRRKIATLFHTTPILGFNGNGSLSGERVLHWSNQGKPMVSV
jgi:hypothetical protein